MLTGDRTDCQIFIINIGSVCIKFTTYYAFRLRNVTKVSFACSPKIHNQQNIKFYANKLAKKSVLLLRKILRLVWSCTPTEKKSHGNRTFNYHTRCFLAYFFKFTILKYLPIFCASNSYSFRIIKCTNQVNCKLKCTYDNSIFYFKNRSYIFLACP